MDVLITGGNGLLGRNLVAACKTAAITCVCWRCPKRTPGGCASAAWRFTG